ncbi:MAG: hypothetical protein AB7S48_05460 [Bacteroidales bacterium]
MYRYIVFVLSIFIFLGCKKDESQDISPIIALKNGDGYTLNNAKIPIGGQLQFGIAATTGSAPLTNVRITRIADGQRIKEDDTGIFIKEGGLDYVVTYNKSSAEVEVWEFFVMNANRDSALTYRTVYLGEGSAYGAIYHYPSVKIGMQENLDYPSLLDVNNGLVYDENTVAGHEADIEILGFVYETSGVMSPTLCCPGYTGTTSPNTFYPYVASWSVKNSILYDYNSSDNDLVSLDDFNQSQNDSLIVNSYKPASVSGLCKYCYTGKIIPFKTHNSKYGLIHVKHSDTSENGYMELEIKIQQ